MSQNTACAGTSVNNRFISAVTEHCQWETHFQHAGAGTSALCCGVVTFAL
jgi:hypothetical protein